ncbi:nitroreductase/quinone reductase family protein [Plantactinospora siamensis]|uniref:Nitroreductase/quinone reductase family protein n=1 Tax=Plantactinospora siamensis TaxID=555372 RepID=A0ABV6P0E4_9ACTN
MLDRLVDEAAAGLGAAPDLPTGLDWAAGFGARSDWYRNLRAHPRAAIQVGGRRRAVTAVPLPAARGPS